MKRDLTPAEIGEQAARRDYLQTQKPKPLKWIYYKDLKVARPVKFPEGNMHSKNVATAEYYGMQECAEMINGRWEHFVSLIKTKELFDKRLKEYESAK